MTDAGLDMGGYRYGLTRDIDRLSPGSGTVTFIMLNPSTADVDRYDPTIRRCKGFALRWGYEKLTVVNLFALRATRPAALKLSANPIGASNDDVIRVHSQVADMVVCAWGDHGNLYHRGAQVAKMLTDRDIELSCLGLTKAGHPRHPLYVNKLADLVEYRP